MIENYPIDSIFNIISLKYDDVIYVTDENIYRIYKEKFENLRTIVIEVGEKSKSIGTIEEIFHHLLHFNADRKTILVGVGGGVVTDITGFVASTYMRGIRFGFVATSLLGMVDAAIGGKNGINFNGYKNMVGTFNLPEFIYWSVDFLDTLPKEEMHNGFGEILKYAIGFDSSLFMSLSDLSFKEIINDKNALETCIKNCQLIKNNIVINDIKESGIRKKLNLGHTVAHAIEKHTSNKIPHGKAVAIGLHAITKYSYDNKYIEIDQFGKILSLLEKYEFLNTNNIELSNESKEYINHDKKGNGDLIDLIVVDDIGSCRIINVEKDKLKF